MIKITKSLFNMIILKGGLILILFALLIPSCTSDSPKFNPDISGPQMLADPPTIRLGVATLMNTDVIFRGQGFNPEDSFAIDLINDKGKIVIEYFAVGSVDEKGKFSAEVDKMIKINGIFNAKLVVNDKGDFVPEISRPPIPEGIYTAKYNSMKTNLKAECKLSIKGPSIGDKIKDRLGIFMGKIKKL